MSEEKEKANLSELDEKLSSHISRRIKSPEQNWIFIKLPVAFPNRALGQSNSHKKLLPFSPPWKENLHLYLLRFFHFFLQFKVFCCWRNPGDLSWDKTSFSSYPYSKQVWKITWKYFLPSIVLVCHIFSSHTKFLCFRACSQLSLLPDTGLTPKPDQM